MTDDETGYNNNSRLGQASASDKIQYVNFGSRVAWCYPIQHSSDVFNPYIPIDQAGRTPYVACEAIKAQNIVVYAPMGGGGTGFGIGGVG